MGCKKLTAFKQPKKISHGEEFDTQQDQDETLTIRPVKKKSNLKEEKFNASPLIFKKQSIELTADFMSSRKKREFNLMQEIEQLQNTEIHVRKLERGEIEKRYDSHVNLPDLPVPLKAADDADLFELTTQRNFENSSI